MKQQTYLYNDTEVVLTGRVAKKENTRKTRTVIKVEIKPYSSQVPHFTKWVTMEDLYKIIINEEEISESR